MKPIYLGCVVKIDAVDLFCGAGGLSYGLQKSGITIRGGIDFDPHCEVPYTKNLKKAKFLLEDINKTDSKKNRRSISRALAKATRRLRPLPAIFKSQKRDNKK